MLQNTFSLLSAPARKAASAIIRHASGNLVSERDKKKLQENSRQLQKVQNQLLETQVEMQKTHVELSLLQEIFRYEKYRPVGDYITGGPLVSIIIVNRNGLDNFRILMKSFMEKDFYRKFEIICVDNGSDDGSPEYLESFRGQFNITVIRNGENKTFSEANNTGARHASGDYYLFLNNDISVTDHWLDELLHTVQAEPKAGAVGARLIYPESHDAKKRKKSYAIQHAGIVFSDVIREGVHFIQPFNRRNGMPDRIHDNMSEHLAAVTAAVMLVSREAFQDVGGFDEGYVYGYEDVDLCLKLTKAGYRNIYCPDSILFHFEFGTQKKDDSDEVYLRRLGNFKRFRERWNDYLAGQMWNDKIQGLHIFTDDPLKIVVLQEAPVPVSQKTAASVEAECTDENENRLNGQNCPDTLIEYYSYKQYEALADEDVAADILIDPAGIYRNRTHRKVKRLILRSLEDMPSGSDPRLEKILRTIL